MDQQKHVARFTRSESAFKIVGQPVKQNPQCRILTKPNGRPGADQCLGSALMLMDRVAACINYAVAQHLLSLILNSCVI